MLVIKAVIYLILCLGVGYLARDTRLGFWGATLISIVVTPLLGFLAFILMKPKVSAESTEA